MQHPFPTRQILCGKRYPGAACKNRTLPNIHSVVRPLRVHKKIG